MQNKIIILITSAIFLAFSSIKQTVKQEQFQNCFPQKIQETYIQKWVAGVRGGGSGTNFYLKLKKPLSKTIQLEKIHFQKQQAKLHFRGENLYTAHFISNKNREEIVLESNSSGQYLDTPIINTHETPNFNFTLKDHEAVLEYIENNKTKFFKLKKIKEKPMIPYP